MTEPGRPKDDRSERGGKRIERLQEDLRISHREHKNDTRITPAAPQRPPPPKPPGKP